MAAVTHLEVRHKCRSHWWFEIWIDAKLVARSTEYFKTEADSRAAVEQLRAALNK